MLRQFVRRITLPPNYSCCIMITMIILIKMMILIKLMLMQVESKLVTMLTHPEAVQCIRSSNVNEEL